MAWVGTPGLLLHLGEMDLDRAQRGVGVSQLGRSATDLVIGWSNLHGAIHAKSLLVKIGLSQPVLTPTMNFTVVSVFIANQRDCLPAIFLPE